MLLHAHETHSQTQLQETSSILNSPIISQDDYAISGSTSSMILTLQPLVILCPNQNMVGKASNNTGTSPLHFETNTVMADSAVEAQLAEKDRELEELHQQLQEAQDKERAPNTMLHHMVYTLYLLC